MSGKTRNVVNAQIWKNNNTSIRKLFRDYLSRDSGITTVRWVLNLYTATF